MNFKKILFVAIFVSLLFDATLFSVPIVFPLCLLCYILYPDLETIVVSLLAGIVLDSIRLTPMGATVLIMALSFCILETVKRSLALKDYKLIILILFIASYVFATIFSYSNNLLIYVLIYAGVGVAAYYLSKKKILWQK